jgi:hypothetical protein
MPSAAAITAEQPIRRAFWTIKAPSMALLLAPMLTYAIASKLGYVPSYGAAGLKWFLPAFLLSFVGGWVVWSIQVPRWRLWAYERVEDIEALKRKAADNQLIWPEGHFFERTEIASRSTWARIRSFEAARSPSGASA